MVIWRNYLILFGGFYEAARDSKWFNDIYFFSFQTKKWMRVDYKPNTQVRHTLALFFYYYSSLRLPIGSKTTKWCTNVCSWHGR